MPSIAIQLAPLAPDSQVYNRVLVDSIQEKCKKLTEELVFNPAVIFFLYLYWQASQPELLELAAVVYIGEFIRGLGQVSRSNIRLK